MPVLNVKKLVENRVNAIIKHHQDAGITRAQLDVSGGVDSAVMLGLLVKALGAENITPVYSCINSSKESEERAQEVADAFGVSLIKLDLTKTYEDLIYLIYQGMEKAGMDVEEIHNRCKADPTILGSIRSCLRAPVGRGANRLAGNGIRHGTGNECEDRWLRFYQKGGDGEVDSNPIAMLSKGEVFQLGIELGVPESIISALPTPDLQNVGEAHNDEDELLSMTGVPFTYSRVDFNTGVYTAVGTIEQISRLADEVDDEIFDESVMKEEENFKYYADLAKSLELFPENSVEEVSELLKAANKMERITRHKMNPNCPSLGYREELIEEGILTNKLF